MRMLDIKGNVMEEFQKKIPKIPGENKNEKPREGKEESIRRIHVGDLTLSRPNEGDVFYAMDVYADTEKAKELSINNLPAQERGIGTGRKDDEFSIELDTCDTFISGFYKDNFKAQRKSEVPYKVNIYISYIIEE